MKLNPGQPFSSLLSLCEGDLLGGRYRLEALLAVRGSAVHFEATDLTRGTRVSAQVLRSSDPSSSSSVAESTVAALAGANRAKALSSPFTARVLDAGVTFEGHAWIVREHLASATVATHLCESGALATAEAVDVALGVCDAIAEAHAQGILHGSLGPHAVHIAWSASGLVDIKVTGMGTADVESKLSLGGMSGVESILRAPEQLRDGAVIDGRADVWAIGVLLHTMLVGASPFPADAPSGASFSVVFDEPPSLAGVPDELAEIVERALSTRASARPATVIELANAIVCFASHPDIARDRIAARRPPALGLAPNESDPTLVMDRSPFATEDEVAAIADAPAPKYDSVAPSVHNVADPIFRAPRLPSFGMRPRRTNRDAPTVITRRPDDVSFPRRRMLKYLGAVTAAASVALLVLIGTEGARLSSGPRGSFANRLARTTTVAAPPPPETTPLVPPVAPIMIDAPTPAAALPTAPEPVNSAKVGTKRSRKTDAAHGAR